MSKDATPTMNSPTQQNEWAPDVKQADPSVLPEYVALPTSPSAPAPAPAPATYTSPDLNAGFTLPPPATAQEAPPTGPKTAFRRIFRSIAYGLLAITIPPYIIAAATLAAAAAMLYGVGKLLEGVGHAIALGPELLYKACVGKRAKDAWRSLTGMRGRRAEQSQETGQIAI